jgi:lipoprotein NlpI
MRFLKLLCLVAAGVGLASPSFAASQAEWTVCDSAQAASIDRPLPANSPILVAAIGGCTKIVERKSETAEDRASAYNSRGDAYQSKGDYDHAIADYSDVIRLDPKVVRAYYSRAATYNIKADPDRAIADYTQAIRLDPDNSQGYLGRGDVSVGKGDYNRAVADYGEAVRLVPRMAVAYRARGFAYLYGGDLAKALADVNKASELDPTDAYGALWLDIVAQRDKVPSRLSDMISKIDMTQWPGPVIRMFLGQMTQAAVLAAANDPAPETKRGQICEANFYTGELELRQGSKNEAIRLFRLASSECPRDFLEQGFANAELKALSATP